MRPVTNEDRNFRSERGRRTSTPHNDRNIFAPDSEDGEVFDPSHDSFKNSFANENDLRSSASAPTTSLHGGNGEPTLTMSPHGENGEPNLSKSTVEPSSDENSELPKQYPPVITS